MCLKMDLNVLSCLILRLHFPVSLGVLCHLFPSAWRGALPEAGLTPGLSVVPALNRLPLKRGGRLVRSPGHPDPPVSPVIGLF